MANKARTRRTCRVALLDRDASSSKKEKENGDAKTWMMMMMVVVVVVTMMVTESARRNPGVTLDKFFKSRGGFFSAIIVTAAVKFWPLKCS